MIGAIAGDIIGSVYEGSGYKSADFKLFPTLATYTDDTVLTMATAKVLLEGGDYTSAYRDFGLRYPNRGYGGSFIHWIYSHRNEPYNSWGNGSAMRVSPVGFACKSEEEVLFEAQRSAEVTHNHPEGIKGAQATALSVYLARMGNSKQKIRERISEDFGYDLNRSIAEIRPHYKFDVSCQGSVPEAILAFLDSSSYEEAIRLAISLGGDSDTQACIAGGIAQAYYKKIPQYIMDEVECRIPREFYDILTSFNKQFGLSY